jgi:hypothetical protein
VPIYKINRACDQRAKKVMRARDAGRIPTKDDYIDLNPGLERILPASDPVYITGNSTADGTTEAQNEQDVEPAPKVDAALAAVRSRNPSEREEMALAELQAMKEELSLLAPSAGAGKSRASDRSAFQDLLACGGQEADPSSHDRCCTLWVRLGVTSSARGRSVQTCSTRLLQGAWQVYTPRAATYQHAQAETFITPRLT